MTWREWGRYALNIAVALDQLLNALLGGDPDETLSSAAGKIVDGTVETPCRTCRWAARIFCTGLDLVDRGHCVRAVERDEGKNAVSARVGGGRA